MTCFYYLLVCSMCREAFLYILVYYPLDPLGPLLYITAMHILSDLYIKYTVISSEEQDTVNEVLRVRLVYLRVYGIPNIMYQ